MNLVINNIGMIQSADVKLDGLTVIAGENDTGKSTVGKMLFSTVKVDNIRIRQKRTEQTDIKSLMATWLNLVFDGNVSNNGTFELSDNGTKILDLKVKDKNFVQKFNYHTLHNERPFFDVTMVQSPIVFDMASFFESVMRLKETQRMERGDLFGTDFNISYPVIIWDLYNKISNKNPFPKADTWEEISDSIFSTINGAIKKENGKFLYQKQRRRRVPLSVEITNTAFGIKSFGLLQLLNDNGYLNKKYLLILDEPEVHLHPEWQVKYAELIVELVKNEIYVLVNSHSPYMIQALKFYSDKQQKTKEKTSFYLAEKGEDNYHSVIADKTDNLNAIFQKLAKPMNEIVWG
jgi:predicted ATPase